MKFIKCACGCNKKTTNRDSRNRPRIFIHNHHLKNIEHWWSKKPIESVNVWYCRKIARDIYLKKNRKYCKLNILNNCSKRIEIHHIDSNIRNNLMENLISLCTRHHILVEKGYIDLNKPKNINFYMYPNGRIIYCKNKQYKKMILINERRKMGKIIMPIATCKKCNAQWQPRIENPKKCPYCQRRNWNKPRKEK